MTIISLDRVVNLLQQEGYTARVENTGGGTMCVFAGTAVGDRWAAVAGPGWTQAGGVRLADTRDFYVGPDDQEAAEAFVSTIEASTRYDAEQEAADRIKRTIAETETVRGAVVLLRNGMSPEDVARALEQAWD